MSYTPINWQTGDVITAPKLNKMDNGWEIGNAQLFSELVTTAESSGLFGALLAYEGIINYSTITVTFNNNEYICERIVQDGFYYYGGFSPSGPDFSEYPFAIQSSENGTNMIFTSTAGTFSVSAMANVVNISDDFRDAVNESIGFQTPLPFLCIPHHTTYAEMILAVASGRLLYFYDANICHFITSFEGVQGNDSVKAVPEGVVGTKSFGFDSNMIFDTYSG